MLASNAGRFGRLAVRVSDSRSSQATRLDVNAVHKAYKQLTEDGMTCGFAGHGTCAVEDVLTNAKLCEDREDAVLSPALAAGKVLGCARISSAERLQ